MGVIIVWLKWFAPKPPLQPPPSSNQPAQSAPANTTNNSAASQSQKPGVGTNAAAPTSTSAATATPAAPQASAQEASIVVENALYRVDFSNRGGVVKSWQLKNYLDDNKPPRILDVVHPQSS